MLDVAMNWVVKVEIDAEGAAALILPPDVVVRHGMEEGSAFNLTEMDDGSLRLTPHNAEFDRAMAVVETIIDDYKDTLTVLAR